MRKIFFFVSALAFGCGSGGQDTTPGAASALGSSSDTIFKDWSLAIPQADAVAIYNLADAPSAVVQPAYQKSYEDIVINRRLNLSGLKNGTNVLSIWRDLGGCEVTREFSISFPAKGQIVISRTQTKRGWACGAQNGLLTVSSLFYTYSLVGDRLTVCGYDDAAFTSARGCASSN